MELPSFHRRPGPAYHFNPKPKVLWVADIPEWSFDRKGREYRKHISQFDIDIAYANEAVKQRGQGHLHYRNVEKEKHYDVILHLHDGYIKKDSDFQNYITKHNENDTIVLCTLNNVQNVPTLQAKKHRLEMFNGLSVNNPYIYNNCKEVGIEVYYTPDGYAPEIFMSCVPIEKRDFKVIFVASHHYQEHKGYSIWKEVCNRLESSDIGFIEVLADSFDNKRSHEEMCDLYNTAQVYVCMSVSEGGPCPLQESAACGCVPICTKVGYTEYLSNIFIVNRNADEFVERIKYLKDNPEVLYKMSKGIQREVQAWQSSVVAQTWAYFIERRLLKSKGIYL